MFPFVLAIVLCCEVYGTTVLLWLHDLFTITSAGVLTSSLDLISSSICSYILLQGCHTQTDPCHNSAQSGARTYQDLWVPGRDFAILVHGWVGLSELVFCASVMNWQIFFFKPCRREMTNIHTTSLKRKPWMKNEKITGKDIARLAYKVNATIGSPSGLASNLSEFKSSPTCSNMKPRLSDVSLEIGS